MNDDDKNEKIERLKKDNARLVKENKALALSLHGAHGGTLYYCATCGKSFITDTEKNEHVHEIKSSNEKIKPIGNFFSIIHWSADIEKIKELEKELAEKTTVAQSLEDTIVGQATNISVVEKELTKSQKAHLDAELENGRLRKTFLDEQSLRLGKETELAAARAKADLFDKVMAEILTSRRNRNESLEIVIDRISERFGAGNGEK